MQEIYGRLAADPAFQAYSRRRARFNWTLTCILLVAYYAFIAVIAFRPALFAVPIAEDSVITWGIPAGFAIIVLSLALTGLYIAQSKRDFDPALRAIIERAEHGTGS